MCGLAGWFDVTPDGPPPDVERRARALEILAPRGPDGEGAQVAEDGSWGLLHRRLAVVDLEHGAQPMAGPRPGQWLAWNGELFDHVERRRRLAQDGEVLSTRSDSEVLAWLLDRDGRDALGHVPAQFALAWLDGSGRQPELTLARDLAGEKPLFWTRSGGRFLFASTLAALRALDPTPREIDGDALSIYLSWGFVPAPLTIFRGIYKLRAGEWLHAVAGRTIEAGVLPRANLRPELTPGAEVEALRAALASASRLRHASADVPVGVFLSSGLDSLAVAAVLRDAPGLRTFTVRARDPRLDESAAAARTARALGVPHEIIDPPPEDPAAWRHVLARFGEPFGSTSALAVDAVARAAAPHVKVVLTGDGGDEALGGYPRHVLLRRLASAPRLPPWAVPSEGPRLRRFRRTAGLMSLSAADRYAAMYEVFGAARAEVLPGDDGSVARDLVRHEWGDAPPDDLRAMLRVDRALELADSHCVKVDVACMGHGVEPRSPWLDPAVVAVCDALPARLRVRGSRTKIALRELLRRELPAGAAREVLRRRKRGFTTGFEGALRGDAVRDLLLGGPLGRVPGLRPEGAARLLEEHRAGRGNHVFRLAVLVALALFAEDNAL